VGILGEKHGSVTPGPFAWLVRAFRMPGQERRTLLQTAKAAVAAMAAWLLATVVLRLPQPFLAPYAAVFLVEATVYRSLRGWAQQVGSVAAGVLLAAAAGQLIPWTTVTLGAVVFAGLLVGSWRRFGGAGVWVGVTGMLVVSYGAAHDAGLLGDRLLETALGAAVGLAVNVLIFPPLHGERLATAADRLARALAGLLCSTAALVRTDEPAEAGDGLAAQAQDVRSLAAAAEEAIGLTREERFLNPLGRGAGAGHHHERPLATLSALWPPTEQLVTSVRAASEGREPFAYPWADARETVAELLCELATAVRAVAGPGEPVDLGRCRELLARIEHRLVVSQDGVRASLGLGVMALPARQLLDLMGRR
jgi:hypothetical protein